MIQDRFTPFCTQLPQTVSHTVDFILEDENTSMEDLITYFHQVIEYTLPEHIRECEICAMAIRHFNMDNLLWSSSWRSLKDCFAKSYKEVLLYANVEGLRMQFIRDKSNLEASYIAS